MEFLRYLAVGRLQAALVILFLGISVVACSGGGNDGTSMESESTATETPATETPDSDSSGDSGSMMTELGEWNTLTAGSLAISDSNNVLGAGYDSSGNGNVTPGTPVQPSGTGTATWTGMWSGKIAVSDDPEAASGLAILGVDPAYLETMGGVALVTACFEGEGVEAAVTYQDLGLDALQLTELTSAQVPVTDGTFQPGLEYSNTFSAGPISLTVTGDITGEAAFGGTGAAGVVGYMGGGLAVEYGQGPRSLGTLQSVFYGSKDSN